MVSGNVSNLMNLFSDKPNSDGANKIQSKMNSGIVNELISKLGLSPAQSKNIAEVALPALINMITKKNNATPENDSSPLSEIFGAAGKGGLLGGLAKNLMDRFLKK